MTYSEPVAYVPWDILLPINKDVLPYGPDGIPFPFDFDYTWIYATAIGIAFVVAMGIGANDVANSFATSVGSKSLTLLQALVVAGIFEFAGAVLLGAQVTDTVKGKIVDPADFEAAGRPDLLMMGMFCSLISVGFWLFMATFLGLPVSTTHSTVGAILGFGLCVPFADIDWAKLGEIVASWFLSPVLAATVSAIFFSSLRAGVLRAENAFDRCLKVFPVVVWFTLTINTWFVIIKGGKAYGWADSLGGEAASFGVAAGVSAAVTLISAYFINGHIRKVVNETESMSDAHVKAQKGQPDDLDLEDGNCASPGTTTGSVEIEADCEAIADMAPGPDFESDVPVAPSTTTPNTAANKKKRSTFSNFAAKQNDKIHATVTENEKVSEMHANAEVFDSRAETAFGYLQVFTACAMAFAHGSNDVANAIGPLSSVAEIYQTNGILSSKSAVPLWILVLGGAGIVVGLALFGHIVIRALGVKLIKITPSRGASIELATAFVIVIGSILGLPLSTTHTMVGASIGVGICDSLHQKNGACAALNYKLLLKIFGGWIFTIVIAAAVSAFFFSLITYAPSMNIPLAAQNAMAEYGVTAGAGTIVAENMTYFVGNPAGTGSFPVIN